MTATTAGVLIAIALFLLYLIATGKLQAMLSCFKQYAPATTSTE